MLKGVSIQIKLTVSFSHVFLISLQTCFISTACVNSLPKVKCVIAISSRINPNCSALATNSDLVKQNNINEQKIMELKGQNT